MGELVLMNLCQLALWVQFFLRHSVYIYIYVTCIVYWTSSSGLGIDRYRSADAAGDRLLLWLPLQDLLEEAQGQGLQEGTQERRRPPQRSDTQQHAQGQSRN